MATRGKGIFLVYTDVDPQHEAEINEWYNTEHLAELLAVPGIPPPRATKQPKVAPSTWRLTNSKALR